MLKGQKRLRIVLLVSFLSSFGLLLIGEKTQINGKDNICTLDTGRKLNVHKAFRRRLMYVKFTSCVQGVKAPLF